MPQVRSTHIPAFFDAQAERGAVIAANNLYDVHYIKYHTGLDAAYIPSWCGSEGDLHYSPIAGKALLIGPVLLSACGTTSRYKSVLY